VVSDLRTHSVLTMNRPSLAKLSLLLLLTFAHGGGLWLWAAHDSALARATRAELARSTDLAGPAPSEGG